MPPLLASQRTAVQGTAWFRAATRELPGASAPPLLAPTTRYCNIWTILDRHDSRLGPRRWAQPACLPCSQRRLVQAARSVQHAGLQLWRAPAQLLQVVGPGLQRCPGLSLTCVGGGLCCSEQHSEPCSPGSLVRRIWHCFTGCWHPARHGGMGQSGTCNPRGACALWKAAGCDLHLSCCWRTGAVCNNLYPPHL